MRPDIKGIVKAYEKAYREHGTAAATARRAAAARHALDYDIDKVFARYWEPWLGTLAATPEVVEFDGLKWAIGSSEQNGDTLALGHEVGITDLVLGMIPEGGVFLDVGAHVGHYAVRAAGRCSKVIAVEANPSTAERLLDNVEVNGIGNVTILQMAAWDCGTYLHLAARRNERDGGTQVHEEGDGVEVQAARLDVVLDGEDRIDLVKIDVEGADLHVLRGMEGILHRCQPVLFIEDHSIYDGMYDRADLDALIKELGYEHEDVPGGGWLIARPVTPARTSPIPG